MLVLQRKEGDWLEIEHAGSGDVLYIRTYDIQPGRRGRLSLAFDDPSHKYHIRRPKPTGGEVARCDAVLA